jgi:arylsulfatase A-like enzyme
MIDTVVQNLLTILGASALVAAVFTMLLTIKALKDYTQAGPKLQREIIAQFRLYLVWAVTRLSLWAFVIAAWWATAGGVAYLLLGIAFDRPASYSEALVAASAGLLLALVLQFSRTLLYCPAAIAMSSHYLMSRFHGMWESLSETRLRAVGLALWTLGTLLIAAAMLRLTIAGEWASLSLVTLSLVVLVVPPLWAARTTEPTPLAGRAGTRARPNILMIGSDTLRADRLGVAGYRRALTPCLDTLAERGTWFAHCYVPCGRTAPSLISLLTGTWPHTHGVRDNFVGDSETALNVSGLPKLLAEHGYACAAVSDWCGGDLGKFPLGFTQLDLPHDQWNVKHLIRQGPKDLRLFVSLFLRNRLGKRILPEIYYLAGVPLTSAVGRDARTMLNRLADGDAPFLLNVFLSTTHPPFGSEYPYYTLFSDPRYHGESKFAMARLTDPFEIIRRQGDGRKEFDLDQILDLYDGCVKNFDDEVARILGHLGACGLTDNTIVVVYSDHGMEFFEHETWGQGNSVVSDFSAKIPLILHDPRRNGGNRVDSIIRTVDLAPTLLELVGLVPPPAMEGVSLAACLDGAPAPELAAFTESGIWLTDMPGMHESHLRYPDLPHLLEVPDRHTGTLAIRAEYRYRIVEAKDRMIRAGRWKLVYQPLQEGVMYRLFDVEADPACKHDVVNQHPEVVSELRARLAAWMSADPLWVQGKQHMHESVRGTATVVTPD